MSRENDNRPDELLTRAVAAARKFANADGPAPEVVAQTLTALHDAADRPRQSIRQRVREMSWRIKAVTLTGAVAAALVLSFMLLAPGGNSLALGQVIEKLRTTRCISLIAEMHSPGPDGKVIKHRMRLMDADKSRVERRIPDGNVTTILNGKQTLQLDSSAKTAIVGMLPPGEFVTPLQSLEQLRSLVDKDGHSLGEKTIDGVRAKGFEVLKNGRKITLWANAETGNPIRIEYPCIEVLPPAGPILQVLTDFKFDEEFDPALFSVEVPAGYTVSDFAKKYLLPMEHMVAILKLYSQRTGGQFPPGVEDNGRAIATGFGVPEAKDAWTAEQRELMDHIEGLQLFFKAEKPGQDFQYYPNVKLGDKDRIVFWCKSPAVNAVVISLMPNVDRAAPASPAPAKPTPDKFVAVYGDLRIENLTKDQLPPKPPENPTK
jgi:outer membrane lipoprotein-sorting protein